ncbi:zf-TFIIB domain-containing protein [Actinoalloteichus caeruleus]|uniref:TFIIB-type zinc ribbon-containing protein n=1 Tax=Actinoalloteichus cyanogriseus TaxID=2893586 RepID=UPI0004AA3E69|nr:zf-TFIIB domain-containing protein [Actinoalloteichus caeruleus]
MDLLCPKCHDVMRTYERNGVHIEQCQGCRGIFLDRGELEQLALAERAHYGRPAPPPGPRPGPPPSRVHDRRHEPHPRSDDRYRDRYRDDHRDREYWDDDHRDRDHHGRYRDSRKKRRKDFLDNVFDIFG